MAGKAEIKDTRTAFKLLKKKKKIKYVSCGPGKANGRKLRATGLAFSNQSHLRNKGVAHEALSFLSLQAFMVGQSAT